jgi:hypothetical protein
MTQTTTTTSLQRTLHLSQESKSVAYHTLAAIKKQHDQLDCVLSTAEDTAAILKQNKKIEKSLKGSFLTRLLRYSCSKSKSQPVVVPAASPVIAPAESPPLSPPLSPAIAPSCPDELLDAIHANVTSLKELALEIASAAESSKTKAENVDANFPKKL